MGIDNIDIPDAGQKVVIQDGVQDGRRVFLHVRMCIMLFRGYKILEEKVKSFPQSHGPHHGMDADL